MAEFTTRRRHRRPSGPRSKPATPQARSVLFDRHRARLTKMIAVRFDPRLKPRLDPSDVAQETQSEPAAVLTDYARARPIAFYPWLRQLAGKVLSRLHERHVLAGRRSVKREAVSRPALPGKSADRLARQLSGSRKSPADRLIADELQGAALVRLPGAFRARPRDSRIPTPRRTVELRDRRSPGNQGRCRPRAAYSRARPAAAASRKPFCQRRLRQSRRACRTCRMVHRWLAVIVVARCPDWLRRPPGISTNLINPTAKPVTIASVSGS